MLVFNDTPLEQLLHSAARLEQRQSNRELCGYPWWAQVCAGHCWATLSSPCVSALGTLSCESQHQPGLPNLFTQWCVCWHCQSLTCKAIPVCKTWAAVPRGALCPRVRLLVLSWLFQGVLQKHLESRKCQFLFYLRGIIFKKKRKKLKEPIYQNSEQ